MYVVIENCEDGPLEVTGIFNSMEEAIQWRKENRQEDNRFIYFSFHEVIQPSP